MHGHLRSPRIKPWQGRRGVMAGVYHSGGSLPARTPEILVKHGLSVTVPRETFYHASSNFQAKLPERFHALRTQ